MVHEGDRSNLATFKSVDELFWLEIIDRLPVLWLGT